MKTLLTFIGLLIALTAQGAVVILPLEGFPNTNNIEASDLLLIRHTNSPPGTFTNKNIKYVDFINLISNAIPVTTIYTNSAIYVTNNIGSADLWTNIAGFLQPLNGGTNTLKVDTNNNRGIIIGDTNRAFAFFGWPADNLTFINVRDGSPGHTVNNTFPVGVIDSTGSGAYEGFFTQSGSNPIFSHSSVAQTNAVIAVQLDRVLQETGGYLLLRDLNSSNYVGIQNGGQLSSAIGPNHIRVFSHGGNKLILSTNGNVSFFGSATNYGVVYNRSNFIVSGTSLLQGTLAVNGPAVFLNGLGSTGITNTIGLQSLGRISLGDDPSDLTTSSNTFRQYGPMHIYDDLFMQDIGITANRIMYLTSARQVSTLSTVDPTELGYVDGVTSPIQAQIDAIVTSPTAYEVLTNGVRVALGTNVNWTTGVTGYVSGATLNLGVSVSGGGGAGGSTMWTNTATVLRPIAGSTNFVGGGTQHTVGANTVFATVGGGNQNTVTSNYTTIAGGQQNSAGGLWASIGGGILNETRDENNTIAGGFSNLTEGNNASIGGGSDNMIDFNTDGGGTIAGGYQNHIGQDFGVIAGGAENTNSSAFSAIVGGYRNAIFGNAASASEGKSFIGGGASNRVGLSASFPAHWGVIGGGTENQIRDRGEWSVIGGGRQNQIEGGLGVGATIAGGMSNLTLAGSSAVTIGGGYGNLIYGGAAASTIAGGTNNIIGINSYASAIGGGYLNQIETNAAYSRVGGGLRNTISQSSTHSTIGGGSNNVIGASSPEGTISGGRLNSTEGGSATTVGGGYRNRIYAAGATISGGNNNTIEQGSSSSVIAGGDVNTISSNSAKSFIIGGDFNKIIAGGTNSGVIGSFVTNSTPFSIELGYYNTNKVRIDYTNLTLVGGMKFKMADGAINGYALLTDANGVGTWGAVGGGTYINSSNGFGTNTTFAGTVTNLGNAYGEQFNDRYNILRYGAISGDGLDDSAAILAAAALGTAVIPPGTYDATNLTLAAGTKIVGIGNPEVRLSMSVTSALFRSVGQLEISGLSLNGQQGISYFTVPTQSNRVAIVAGNRSTISDCNIWGFSGVGIWLTNTAVTALNSTNFSKIANCKLWHNWRAVLLQDEYSTVTGTTVAHGYSGYRVESGNCSIVNSPAIYQNTGLDIAGFSNNGHGNYVGGMINHCTTAVLATGIQYGFTIASSQIFGGIINVIASTAIHFDNNHLSITGITGTTAGAYPGTNYFTSNWRVGAIAVTGTTVFEFRDLNGTNFGTFGGNNYFSGNVGIGTNAPAARLQITADNSTSTIFQVGTTNNPSLLTFNTNGLLTVPSGNIRTNTGTMDVTTNLFVLGTRVTNGTRRIFVAASAQLNAATAGTAKITLYVENAGSSTNRLSVAAGPLASLTTVEALFMAVSPGSIYYFTDETSGVGATASLLPETCSVTAF